MGVVAEMGGVDGHRTTTTTTTTMAGWLALALESKQRSRHVGRKCLGEALLWRSGMGQRGRTVLCSAEGVVGAAHGVRKGAASTENNQQPGAGNNGEQHESGGGWS